MESRTKHVGVVTLSSHEEAIAEWLGPHAASTLWVEDDENPDLEGVLRAFAKQLIDVAVIDDAALPYREVSEHDLLKHLDMGGGKPARIVFVAAPDRRKDDTFLLKLAASGSCAVLATRYYADDPEEAARELLRLVEDEEAARLAPEALSSLQEKRGAIPLIGKGRGRTDILSRAEVCRDEEEGVPMEESEYFERMRGRKSQVHADKGSSSAAPRERRPMKPSRDEIAESVSALREMAREEADAPKADPIEREDVDALAEAVFERVVEKLDARSREACEASARQTGEEAERRRRQLKIAVAGISRSVGTTHLATCLAFHLAEERAGQRIGLLMADKREYDAMTGGGAFPAKDGLPCHKGVRFGFMGANPLPEDFDIAVYDCGTVSFEPGSRAHRLFSTAQRKLVVAGGPPWRINEAIKAVEGREGSECNDWTWCYFGAASQYVAANAKHLASKGLRHRCFRIPYDTAYLEPGRRPNGEFKSLLHPQKTAEASEGDEGSTDDRKAN